MMSNETNITRGERPCLSSENRKAVNSKCWIVFWICVKDWLCTGIIITLTQKFDSLSSQPSCPVSSRKSWKSPGTRNRLSLKSWISWSLKMLLRLCGGLRMEGLSRSKLVRLKKTSLINTFEAVRLPPLLAE